MLFGKIMSNLGTDALLVFWYWLQELHVAVL